MRSAGGVDESSSQSSVGSTADSAKRHRVTPGSVETQCHDRLLVSGKS